MEHCLRGGRQCRERTVAMASKTTLDPRTGHEQELGGDRGRANVNTLLGGSRTPRVIWDGGLSRLIRILNESDFVPVSKPSHPRGGSHLETKARAPTQAVCARRAPRPALAEKFGLP